MVISHKCNLTGFVRPYIFSVLPAGAVPKHLVEGNTYSSSQPPHPQQQPQPALIPTTVVQIRSFLTLLPTQKISYPFGSSGSSSSTFGPQTSTANATVKCLTSSPSAKSPLFLVTTPTDKGVAATEGSTIWQFSMKPWAEQVDELVQAGRYADALTLLDVIDEAVLPDKVKIRFHSEQKACSTTCRLNRTDGKTYPHSGVECCG